MTRLAPISPISSARYINTGSYNLYFTEYVMEEPDYGIFWRYKSGIKIMDCLIHEDKPRPSVLDVYRAAKMSKPTIIVVPDIKYNSQATLISFDEYANDLKDLGTYLMGVAQGQTIEETLSCARLLLQRTTVLGLHQGIKRKLGMDRMQLALTLHKEFPDAKFHMLGIPPTGYDFHPAEYILGCDSAKPVYQGLSAESDPPVHRPGLFLSLPRGLVIPSLDKIRVSIESWETALKEKSYAL